MNKEGRFYRNCGAASVGVLQDNLFLSTQSIKPNEVVHNLIRCDCFEIFLKTYLNTHKRLIIPEPYII